MLGKGTTGEKITGLILLGCVQLFGQQAPVATNASQLREFPVIMREKISAGTMPIGTKVEAKLLVATLVNGVVIPRGALLSGEVTESVAKSAAEPSRLAIRMDSAQWKNGSAPIKAYLTAWYYPEVTMSNQDLSYEPADAAKSPRNWNGAGTYPDQNNPASQPFPGRDQGHDSPASPPAASSISKRRVLMKNIESTTTGDGAVILTSNHGTIKLDKITTYVLANGDLMPRN
jgi:hypothetical protein